jgi:hypothetical protein
LAGFIAWHTEEDVETWLAVEAFSKVLIGVGKCMRKWTLKRCSGMLTKPQDSICCKQHKQAPQDLLAIPW